MQGASACSAHALADASQDCGIAQLVKVGHVSKSVTVPDQRLNQLFNFLPWIEHHPTASSKGRYGIVQSFWFKPDLDRILGEMAEIPGTDVTGQAWLDASNKWIAECKRVQAFGAELDKWTSSRAADRSQDLDAIRQARMTSFVLGRRT